MKTHAETPSPTGKDIRFVFVRHGEADGVAGRCIGHTDAPLSTRGAIAIRTLSLGAFDRIVSSDLTRAADSAHIIAEVSGVPVQVDARLREMNFGAWDGCSWAELEQTDGVALATWMESWTTATPPNGESVSMLAARVASWLEDEIAQTPNDATTIVVVAHAGSIRTAICLLTGKPFSEMFDISVEHAHAYVVETARGQGTFTRSQPLLP